MPDINALFPSKFLKKEDIANPTRLTIAGIKAENVAAEGQPAEPKPAIYWREADVKPMVLNRTNANILSALYGSNTDGWTDKPIVVYNDPTVQYAGRLTGGLRLRQADNPQAELPPSNIPPAQPQQGGFDPATGAGSDDIPW